MRCYCRATLRSCLDLAKQMATSPDGAFNKSNFVQYSRDFHNASDRHQRFWLYYQLRQQWSADDPAFVTIFGTDKALLEQHERRMSEPPPAYTQWSR